MSAERRSRILRFGSSEGGATAVEFAIVLPVLIVLLFGVFEFGYAQHKLSSLRYAMKTASRSLLLDPTTTEQQLSDKVKAILGDIGDPNVTVTLAINTTSAGKTARLTGAYSTSIGIPTLAAFPLNWQTSVDTVLPAA